MKAAVWLGFGLGACAGEPEATWHRDIRPVVEGTCMGCHVDGGAGPMPLTTLDEARDWGTAMVEAVAARQMPPWGMDADCRDVEGSMWLTDAQVAAFVAWGEGGFPEGDAEEYVPVELPESFEPGPADEVLQFDTPYLPKSGVDDDYRCVPVGAPLASDLYLRGMDIRPDQVDLVHHVLLYAVPPGDLDEVATLDDADEDVGWTCFGTSGVGSAQTVGGWAPGGDADLLDDGVAIRVPKGAQLVVQVHYNLATEDPAPDQTEIALWTVPDDVVPDWFVVTYPVAHTTFQVFAGEESRVAKLQVIPADAMVVGTSPHMHTRGVRLETTLVRQDGSEECLSRVPNYDFQWQRDYTFLDSVPLGPTDAVEIACTFDNTDNESSVTWGDGTADEMCLDYLGLLVPNTTNGEQGVCAGFEGCFADCASDDSGCAFACMAAAGESCLYCGADQMFEGCVAGTCEATSRSLGLCVLSCMDGIEEFFGCATDVCGTQLAAHWECAEPALRGSCSDALDACDQ